MKRYTRDKSWDYKKDDRELFVQGTLPQSSFGEIENVDIDGGDATMVGDYVFDFGYRKGEIELKWPDGAISVHRYRVETIESGGSNHPYDEKVFVKMEVRGGVEAEVNLACFHGKATGRVISIEER